MKIAILGFAYKNHQYGGAQWTFLGVYKILEQMAQTHNVEPELVIPVARKSALKSKDIGKNTVDLSGYRYRTVSTKEFVDIINNEYDYVIMACPGVMKGRPGDFYYDSIMQFKIPFTFGIQSEMEDKLYPHLADFLSHPMLNNVKVIDPVNYNCFGSDRLTSLLGSVDIHYSEPWLDPKFLVENPKIDEMIENKTNSIMFNSRWVSWKRLDTLLEISKDLVARSDLSIDVYGDGPFFHETERLKSINPKSWNHCGRYTSDQIPEIYPQYRFVWNASGRWRTKSIKRLEASTLEAVWYGCIPILSYDMCPDWYVGDHMIAAQVHSSKKEVLRSQLLEQIVEMVDNKLINELAKKAYTKMRLRNNLETAISDMSKMITVKSEVTL